MLLHQLVLEHSGWKLDKGLELDLAIVIQSVADGKQIQASELSEKGQTKLNHILSVARVLVGSKSKVEVVGKPSGARPSYGAGAEPKSDLNIVVGTKAYSISVKGGPAYAMSAGSKTEYNGLIAATIEMFEQLFPQEAAKLKAKIVAALEPIAQSIKSSDYSANALKKKKDGWFNRGTEKLKSDDERDEIRRLEKDAIEIIEHDNEQLRGKYKASLLRMETQARELFAEAFSVENFARCFVWEITTGVKKFGGLTEIGKFSNPQAAYANTLVYLDDGGIFDVSTISCDYVSRGSRNYGVRLQNVPRGWAAVYFKKKREGKEGNARLLADSLREIEFSLKISIGRDANRKIKEQVLSELAVDKTLVQTLINTLRTSSLLEICDAFGILPVVEPK